MARWNTFKDYLLDTQTTDSSQYYHILESLKTLYDGFRAYEKFKNSAFLTTEDLVSYLDILSTSGHILTNKFSLGTETHGVQLVTAHNAKGREFLYVFVVDAVEEVWKSKGKAVLLSSPQNISIQQKKDTDDDFVRLFFVAITRAKKQLHISYPLLKDNAKSFTPLSYILGMPVQHIDKNTQYLGELHTSQKHDGQAPQQESTIRQSHRSFHPYLELQLQYKPRIHTNIHSLLASRLETYKLSVTHLNNFLNIYSPFVNTHDDDQEQGNTIGGELGRKGPHYFRDKNLLNFPSYKSDDARYGTAMHQTISHFVQNELHKTSDKDKQYHRLCELLHLYLLKEKIRPQEFSKHYQKGCKSLEVYWSRNPFDLDRYTYTFEFDFSRQDVFVQQAHITGNIDMIKTDKITGEIEIVDFKTGSELDTFEPKDAYKKVKALQYKRQLQFYKILLKRSRTFSSSTSKITKGTLEFIDTQYDKPYQLSCDLATFDETELEELILAVWEKIMKLDFPSISAYPNTLESLEQFKNDLIQRVV